MIRCSEAIFAVSDVRETVRFYREVLGFESDWLWEDPPTFGGARWGSVQVMFCLNPELAQKIEGHMHMFHVEDVQGLYERHTAAGVTIVHDIGNRPWGMREYTVRDNNGYHLRFGGPTSYERPAGARDSLPEHIRVERRTPAFEDYARLNHAVGWQMHEGPSREALARSLFWVTATDTRDGRVVGLTRVVGDGKAFTIWDVMVLPEYQGQRIGTALMEMALSELRKIGPAGAFVGLFTGKQTFYERLGFVRDGGMHTAL